MDESHLVEEESPKKDQEDSDRQESCSQRNASPHKKKKSKKKKEKPIYKAYTPQDQGLKMVISLSNKFGSYKMNKITSRRSLSYSDNSYEQPQRADYVRTGSQSEIKALDLRTSPNNAAADVPEISAKDKAWEALTSGTRHMCSEEGSCCFGGSACSMEHCAHKESSEFISDKIDDSPIKSFLSYDGRDQVAPSSVTPEPQCALNLMNLFSDEKPANETQVAVKSEGNQPASEGFNDVIDLHPFSESENSNDDWDLGLQNFIESKLSTSQTF